MDRTFRNLIVLSVIALTNSVFFAGTTCAETLSGKDRDEIVGPVSSELSDIFPTENRIARSLVAPATPFLATLFRKGAPADALIGLVQKPQLGKARYLVNGSTMTLFVALYKNPDHAADAALRISAYFTSLSPQPEMTSFAQSGTATLGFMMKRLEKDFYGLRQTGKGLAILTECPSEDALKSMLFRLKLGDPNFTLKPKDGVFGKVKAATE